MAQIWPDGGAVQAHLASTGCSDEHRLLEAYVVLPGAGRPRFLVPLASARAGAASLLRYNRLRSGRTAAARALLATGVRIGAARHWAPVLRVCSTGDAPEESLLTTYLAGALGTPPLAAGIGVRPLDPNSKPTLQLFDSRGTPRGYAKIGWNDATRRLVDNEADALAALEGAGRGFAVPGLLHRGTWQGRHVVVTAPLPRGVRSHADAHVPPPAALLDDLAGPGTRGPFDGSGFDRYVRRELELMQAAGDAPELATAAGVLAGHLRTRWAGHDLRFGRWHGDWVPWNLAWEGRGRRRRLWVFDWEHSAPDAPVGLDLAHWHFQVAFVLEERSLAESMAEVRRACSGGWPELGVSPQDGPAVADLYLLELGLRTYRLFAGGGGWHPRLYPGLLEAFSEAGGDGRDDRARHGRRGEPHDGGTAPVRRGG